MLSLKLYRKVVAYPPSPTWDCHWVVETGIINLHIIYTFSHAHIQTHTHKHTCMINTQKERRELGTGTWLEGAEVGFVTDKGLAHTHTSKKGKKKKI